MASTSVISSVDSIRSMIQSIQITNVNTTNTTTTHTSASDSESNTSPRPVVCAIDDHRLITNLHLEEALIEYNKAKLINFENILNEFYPNLIEKRNNIYSNARNEHNITIQSSSSLRCSVVKTLVQWLFTTIEPPDAYTKATDVTHFDDVGSLATEMYEQTYNESVPVALLLAAWFHDIERFIPETKCRYLHESVDHIRKQAIHALTSARVCEVLLRGAPVTDCEKERIFDLILHHDYPSKGPLIVLGETLVAPITDDMINEWSILQSADSLTFFKCTIVRFVEYKATKNTPLWIWTRVINNIRRLREQLRPKAVESIMDLNNDIKKLMGFNIRDLEDF